MIVCTNLALHDLSLFGRVAFGALVGFVVGWEREVRGHAAGARTFSLVAAGSAAFTVVGVDAFPASSEKLIAGIVTGIGFIGAGVVLRDPAGQIRGLTTAAAIWAMSSVGILSGAGRFVLASLSTALFVVVLELHAIPFLNRLDPQRWSQHFDSDNERDTTSEAK